MASSVGSWGTRGILLLVSILLGMNGAVLFLDIVIETLFFDEATALLVSSALVYLVAKLKKDATGITARFLMWMASGLLTAQLFVIGLDLAITTYFFDELANICINGMLGWIVLKQRNNMKEKA